MALRQRLEVLQGYVDLVGSTRLVGESGQTAIRLRLIPDLSCRRGLRRLSGRCRGLDGGRLDSRWLCGGLACIAACYFNDSRHCIAAGASVKLAEIRVFTRLIEL